MTANAASIVIPTHRRPDLLRNLLESLSHQKTARAFEVIVVNDGSAGDLSMLEVEFSDISVKVIDLPQSRGRAFARNEGVRNSKGDVLIFVDDDMTVVEDFLERHMAAHGDVMTVVIGNVLSAPEYSNDPLARYVERQGVHKLKSRARIHPKCVRTGNVSVSRELFTRIGMFDESISKYGEDQDLGMKFGEAGADLVFAEGAISYHHHPPDIDDMIGKMQEYGRYSVPLLVAAHPQIRQVIRLDLAEPVRIGRECPLVSVRKMILRIALTPPFYRVARSVYGFKWLGSLLYPVIDYIRAYNYIRAYRESQKESAPKARPGPIDPRRN
ncbi:MAG: glycosyltransferase [Candidatus Eisenbacteria bacterium]